LLSVLLNDTLVERLPKCIASPNPTGAVDDGCVISAG
jgi:hypothetical protein